MDHDSGVANTDVPESDYSDSPVIGFVEDYLADISPSHLRLLPFYSSLQASDKTVFRLAVACLKLATIMRVVKCRQGEDSYIRGDIRAIVKALETSSKKLLPVMLGYFESAFERNDSDCFRRDDASYFTVAIGESFKPFRHDNGLSTFLSFEVDQAANDAMVLCSMNDRGLPCGHTPQAAEERNPDFPWLYVIAFGGIFFLGSTGFSV
jgi:hypothetical protein